MSANSPDGNGADDSGSSIAASSRSGLRRREIRDEIVIRFAGDSGDGIQLTGTQFAMESALAGADIATFPDYPAEIRAPAGT